MESPAWPSAGKIKAPAPTKAGGLRPSVQRKPATAKGQSHQIWALGSVVSLQMHNCCIFRLEDRGFLASLPLTLYHTLRARKGVAGGSMPDGPFSCVSTFSSEKRRVTGQTFPSPER